MEDDIIKELEDMAIWFAKKDMIYSAQTCLEAVNRIQKNNAELDNAWAVVKFIGAENDKMRELLYEAWGDER